MLGTQASVALLSVCPGYCDLQPFPRQHLPSRDAHMAKTQEGHDEGWNFSLKYLPPQQTLEILGNLAGNPKDAVFHVFLGMGGKAGVSLELGPHLPACFQIPV